MAYLCNMCNKQFITPSKLKLHLNRKNPCVKLENDLECTHCDVKFKCNAEKVRHEKTNKHISNITINVNGDFHNGDNFNNIVNLTLVTNPFEFTNLTCIDSRMVSNLHQDYEKTLNRCENDKFVLNFRSIIYLLGKIHFDIRDNGNQNLKILLMFPNLEKKVIEYMILEINPHTKAITWNRIEYGELLDKLIGILEQIHDMHNIEEFVEYIDYMKSVIYLDCNKKNIETMLTELYKKYNKEQHKVRETDEDLIKNINLYKNYRDQELKLPNGYLPPTINVLI